MRDPLRKAPVVSLIFDVWVCFVLFLTGTMLSSAARRIGLLPPAVFVLTGIAAASLLPEELQFELTPATLAIFLPALIFEAAWNVDLTVLRRVAPAIAVLAIPGVFATAAIAVAAGIFAGGMSLAAAFALGAIVSATDPVAVLAIVRDLPAFPKPLATILEGESIANDGMAVALFGVATALVAATAPGGTSHGTSVAAVALVGLYGPIAGIAVGIAVTAVAGWLRHLAKPWGTIAVTLAIAYGSYFLAARIGASGIFASAAAGIVLPKVIGTESARATDRFWSGLASLANGAVFVLAGISLHVEHLLREPALAGATVAAALFSRVVLAYGMVPIRKLAAGFELGWRHSIALVGVRGGLSLALALGLPAAFPSRSAIIDAVSAVVFVTLVPGSWILEPLLRRCKLGIPTVTKPVVPVAPG